MIVCYGCYGLTRDHAHSRSIRLPTVKLSGSRLKSNKIGEFGEGVTHMFFLSSTLYQSLIFSHIYFTDCFEGNEVNYLDHIDRNIPGLHSIGNNESWVGKAVGHRRRLSLARTDQSDFEVAGISSCRLPGGGMQLLHHIHHFWPRTGPILSGADGICGRGWLHTILILI